MAVNPPGFKDRRPDPAAWKEILTRARKYRERATYEKSWPKWRKYLRGDWPGHIMPVNLFHTMVNTIVPRVYFRDPTISVQSALPGIENMILAKTLERASNKVVRRVNLKRHMKASTHDAFLMGTGVLKPGFGAIHGLSPDDFAMGSELIDSKGRLVEVSSDTEPMMPFAFRAHPGTVLIPAGAPDFQTAEWICYTIKRPLYAIKNDPRFSNTKNLQGVNLLTKHDEAMRSETRVETEEMVMLNEIHHRPSGTVFVISDDVDKPLLFSEDPVQIEGVLPGFPLIFNEDDMWGYGIPDAKILEPYQLEINEINTQIQAHRRSSLIKLLIEEGGMGPAEAERLVNSDVNVVAWTKGNPDRVVKVIQSGQIPQDLFLAAREVYQNVREAVGFSRNQFGEFNSRSGDTTATEANIVRQASEIRIDQRRDAAADLLQQVVRYMHIMMFQYWRQEQIIDLVGPGGVPVFLRFRGDLLRKGRYSIKVDPDSGLPETRGVREQRAVQFYQLLRQEPLVDPNKLVQWTLMQFQGPHFDEMMAQLPPVAGVQPGQTLTPQQLGQVIQQGVANAA